MTAEQLYTNGYTIEFGHALMRGLGVPDTADNHLFLAAWSGAEGGRATFNPFNSGQSAPGATAFNRWVNNYPSLQVGLDATIANLQSTTFDYSPILRALAAGSDAYASAAALDQTPWGTGKGAFALMIGDGTRLWMPPAGSPLQANGPMPPLFLGSKNPAILPPWCIAAALRKGPLPIPPAVTGLKLSAASAKWPNYAFQANWDLTPGIKTWDWLLTWGSVSQHHIVKFNSGVLYGIPKGQTVTLKVAAINAQGVLGKPQSVTVKT